MTVLKEKKTRPSIRKISFRSNCFARQADLTILGEMFDYAPGSKRLVDTPEPGTIDELCRRFAGTIGIGEDHFAGIAKSAKYIFPPPNARQPLEVVLRLLPD